MRILLIGSGMLGSSMGFSYRNDHETFLTYTNINVKIDGCDVSKLDVSDGRSVSEFISRVRPDIVINTAAIIDLKVCETQKDLAYSVNVAGARNVAEACNSAGCKMIHISTDYVFDGLKGFYTEESNPNPLSYYAKTKLEAEREVMEACPESLIARTTIVGWGVKDFRNIAHRVVRALESGDRIVGFTDSFFTPIFTFELAKRILDVKELLGVYNLGGPERISKYDFTVKISDTFKLDKSLIDKGSFNSLNDPMRPRDTSLIIEKAKRLGFNPSPLADQMNEMRDLREKFFNEVKVV